MDSATLAGVVSAVITFLALIVSSIQLLYQYYTNVSLNALGARNCNERVMGPWARATRRRWRWLELRFEIIFEAPTLFVAPAWNTRGPVLGQPVSYINGSAKSYADTRTTPPPDLRARTIQTSYDGLPPEVTPKTTVQQVNVEATWVALLRALQAMERESEMWQTIVHSGEPREEPPSVQERTLAVAVQAQTLSWDFVPNFKKPFANTTIGHIVEIAAMLGIHWTTWDSATDRYRAEGNGVMLLGSFIAEQGIVFQLIRHANSEFRENRVIPCHELKRYCFGFVPTFYYIDKYDKVPETSEYNVPSDPIIPLLKLGSRQEVTETLMEIGCPVEVAEHFLNKDARVSHLFPVVFDIIGMLGRMVSIKGYCYRMLPNPTVFRWDRKWFDTRRLLAGFSSRFSEEVMKKYGSKAPEPLSAIASALGRFDNSLLNPDISDWSPPLLENLRKSIATADTHLTSISEDIILETVVHHVTCVVADLSRAQPRLLKNSPPGRVEKNRKEANYLDFLFERSRFTAREAAGLYLKEPWRDDAELRDIAWCLLAFRMLCWLHLHDFHRDDVMVPRSAAFASRMPVYII